MADGWASSVGLGAGGLGEVMSGVRLGVMCKDEMRSTGSGDGSHSVTVAMASTVGVLGS